MNRFYGTYKHLHKPYGSLFDDFSLLMIGVTSNLLYFNFHYIYALITHMAALNNYLSTLFQFYPIAFYHRHLLIAVSLIQLSRYYVIFFIFLPCSFVSASPSAISIIFVFGKQEIFTYEIDRLTRTLGK